MMEFEFTQGSLEAAGLNVPQPVSQGVRLQYILARCREGDLLECTYVPPNTAFTTNCRYRVKLYSALLCIEADDGDVTKTSSALFVLATGQPAKEEQDEHDTWSIGKQCKVPKKEWQPDVMDVDLTKKIKEW